MKLLIITLSYLTQTRGVCGHASNPHAVLLRFTWRTCFHRAECETNEILVHISWNIPLQRNTAFSISISAITSCYTSVYTIHHYKPSTKLLKAMWRSVCNVHIATNQRQDTSWRKSYNLLFCRNSFHSDDGLSWVSADLHLNAFRFLIPQFCLCLVYNSFVAIYSTHV